MNLNVARLSGVAPDLVEFGRRLSSTERKVVARRVAEWACNQSGITSLIGPDRLTFLVDPNYVATTQDRKQLADEMNNLDIKYFAIVEQFDGLDDAGEALQWFGKARAAASLLYALHSEDLANFCDALYEAHAATGDLKELRVLCQRQ
jgi:hypothetical protein